MIQAPIAYEPGRMPSFSERCALYSGTPDGLGLLEASQSVLCHHGCWAVRSGIQHLNLYAHPCLQHRAIIAWLNPLIIMLWCMHACLMLLQG